MKMAIEDYLVRQFLVEKWAIVPIVFAIFLVIVVKKYYNTVYAYALYRLSLNAEKSKKLTAIKRQLFSHVKPGQHIVEIGAGTGTNCQYYPEGCSVTCIEPKLEFESYINYTIKKKAEHLKEVKFEKGVGENLSRIIAENSVDFVVSTWVLCSVTNEQKVAEEVLTVLKPGGKYLFMEHVLAEETFYKTRTFQNIITHFTRKLLDNCHWNGEPWVHIKRVGFSHFDYDRVLLDKAVWFSPLKHLCVGTATK